MMPHLHAAGLVGELLHQATPRVEVADDVAHVILGGHHLHLRGWVGGWVQGWVGGEWEAMRGGEWVGGRWVGGEWEEGWRVGGGAWVTGVGWGRELFMDCALGH